MVPHDRTCDAAPAASRDVLVRAAPDLARSRHISQISLHLPHLPDLTVSPPDLRQVRAAPDSHYFLQRIAASS